MRVKCRRTDGTGPAIDWDALTEEATNLLSSYLRIDTTNPPGNEAAACAWLAGLLDAEGIPYQVVEAGDGRASLLARLPGADTTSKPLLLLNHIDVVPAEPDRWSQDPFGGAVLNGYVWGRGAIDMKGMAIVQLLMLLLHRRLGLPLRRELAFLAVADEEAGGDRGIEYLDSAHPDLLDCDFVINEGGSGSPELFGVARPVFQVTVAEKSPLWLRVVATGTPGHASVPHDDNPADRLVRALSRIHAWRQPLRLTPPVAAYFEALHLAGLIGVPDTALREALAAEVPRLRSMQCNTVTVTTLQAGVKTNVIPSHAEATLDARLVPGYDPDTFLNELYTQINDPLVRIETLFNSSTPTSSTTTELWRAIEGGTHDVIEDAVVVPSVSTGFTDSRVFRRRGIPAYGFMPVLLGPDDASRTHGHDERLSIENLRLALQILFSVVRRACA